MRVVELSGLLLARIFEPSSSNYLHRVTKRSRKLLQLFKLIENGSKQTNVGLWTHSAHTTFYLGLSETENAVKPDIAIVLDRVGVEDLLIELCAFMMRVDTSELRSFTRELINELESEIGNEQTKMH